MVTLDHFDELIASRSLLLHPFYQKWSKGQLTLDDLRVYAKEYFHLASNVPGLCARVRDRAQDVRPDMVPAIEENMVEETEHIELWKRFAKSLGVTEEELESYEPSMTVKEAVASLQQICDGSFEEGVAGIYALERELPEIAQTKKDGLCEFYGLDSEDAHIYFDEHLGEEKHLQVWMSVDVSDIEGKKAVEKSLDAQNKVLDACCEIAGIDMCDC